MLHQNETRPITAGASPVSITKRNDEAIERLQDIVDLDKVPCCPICGSIEVRPEWRGYGDDEGAGYTCRACCTWSEDGDMDYVVQMRPERFIALLEIARTSAPLVATAPSLAELLQLSSRLVAMRQASVPAITAGTGVIQ